MDVVYINVYILLSTVLYTYINLLLHLSYGHKYCLSVNSIYYGVCLVGTPRPFASPLSNTSLFLFFCSMLVMYCLIKASNK